jgi:hypothetical protein
VAGPLGIADRIGGAEHIRRSWNLDFSALDAAANRLGVDISGDHPIVDHRADDARRREVRRHCERVRRRHNNPAGRPGRQAIAVASASAAQPSGSMDHRYSSDQRQLVLPVNDN